MKKQFGPLAGLCLVFTGLISIGSNNLAAQDQSTTPPPKVLQIVVESLKPGQGGNSHAKTESAFVKALSDAKWPTHYFGMDALSGKSRAVFFTGYDSFDAWQKDMDATMKNTSLAAALDSAAVADGALLDAFETSAYVYREDLSLRGPVDIAHMRFFEITLFRIRPGHGKDWSDLVKIYMAANEKIPNAHWATFEKMYGTESGSRYIAISPMKSMAEVDQEMLDDKALGSSLSDEDRRKIRELTAAAVESIESNLYAMNPKMSYPPDTWVKADPTFWSQK
jgi:hypothetical protein